MWRSDKCAFTNDALFTVVGMAFRETVVLQIVVGNAYGVPIPIVGQGFDVSVVIMLSVQFKVDNVPFLFNIAKVGKIATGKWRVV